MTWTEKLRDGLIIAYPSAGEPEWWEPLMAVVIAAANVADYGGERNQQLAYRLAELQRVVERQ